MAVLLWLRARNSYDSPLVKSLTRAFTGFYALEDDEASKKFVEDNIDDLLQKHSRLVVSTKVIIIRAGYGRNLPMWRVSSS